MIRIKYIGENADEVDSQKQWKLRDSILLLKNIKIGTDNFSVLLLIHTCTLSWSAFNKC